VWVGVPTLKIPLATPFLATCLSDPRFQVQYIFRRIISPPVS
jgi:hypothetical protein